MPRYILLRETASTNTYLARMAEMLPTGTVIYTHKQTAGRGQKGNSWEAEPGKNLTFSMLLKQLDVPVRSQFLISEAVSLAIVDVVKQWVDNVRVKWPNDIYCGDRKLCGILIENSLDNAGIAHTVIGVGLNVNQTEFVSDAPNPVSLAQLAQREFDLEQVLHQVCEAIERLCDFGDDSQRKLLHERYARALYRNDGDVHTFALPDGTQFAATIQSVEPDGMLVLRHEADGMPRSYAFKQVKHVINEIEL
ncbi:MAG: biotin--[acetyl-CoA-carboxylase] ligase [Muribaculaceae bacterium]|nr:biotin--[acetyl-CoA-carboxylase] ligase [Muribaculaceae bacterium]